jgi:hypothetical protein
MLIHKSTYQDLDQRSTSAFFMSCLELPAFQILSLISFPQLKGNITKKSRRLVKSQEVTSTDTDKRYLDFAMNS